MICVLRVPNFCNNEDCVDVLCSVALRCQRELREEEAAAALSDVKDGESRDIKNGKKAKGFITLSIA